jgi:flagellar biosynthesis protein FlhF
MEARKGHCVLVDTAGFAAAEWSGAEALAAALDACTEVDVQLAVPAYMNTADFRRTLERYQIFHPDKLVVTKMDEAQTFGPAFSEAIRAELSLSFVTNGPRVPDDIKAASLEDLVALSQGRPPRGVQRAA